MSDSAISTALTGEIDWSWVIPAIGGALLTVVIGVAGSLVSRWWRRRGTTSIYIGERDAPEYITRGRWHSNGKQIIQDAPRFMNFAIPLTFKNSRDVELTIRIKNVWFADGRPEIGKNGWKLPGSNLHPTGLRIENAAGEISDPIVVKPHGIAHAKIIGTATSPVCHAGPYLTWRFVFVDWFSSPIDVAPFIQEVAKSGGGRSFDSEIEPSFALPDHYPKMQGGA